jgi:glycosyltransferase involved in cell wall biosynthesis
MRICHVSPHLPPDQAANALLPAQLGLWMHEQGHTVSFVTVDARERHNDGSGAVDPLPGPVRRTRPRSTSAFLRFLRIDALQRSRSIVAALDDVATGSDVLHLHSNGLIVEVASAWAHRHGIPTVLTLYGTEIWHYRRRWPVDPFTRAYYRASAVTFYSQRLLDKAQALGLERPGLSVIYPPVSSAFLDVDEPTRLDWRLALEISEPRVVLNVKRLHPLAGQRHLIEAFARVARDRQDVRLVICGTGPLRHQLEQQARDAGIASRVTFAGLVPNDRVARYAAAADVFVLPSELEALPTVAVEALAAGTPVVSTDHPGGTELHAIFGDDVQVVPRGDVDGLARLIGVAVAHPRRTREATGALVRERFGKAAVRDAYDRLYRAVSARR